MSSNKILQLQLRLMGGRRTLQISVPESIDISSLINAMIMHCYIPSNHYDILVQKPDGNTREIHRHKSLSDNHITEQDLLLLFPISDIS